MRTPIKTKSQLTGISRSRATAHLKFIDAALQEVDQAENLLKEHERLLANIRKAMRAGKLARPPKRNHHAANTLQAAFFEEIERLDQAWQTKTLPLDQLTTEAQHALDLGQQFIDHLRDSLAIARTHYRPIERAIERARGH